jgi:hypothetical protein
LISITKQIHFGFGHKKQNKYIHPQEEVKPKEKISTLSMLKLNKITNEIRINVQNKIFKQKKQLSIISHSIHDPPKRKSKISIRGFS